MQLINGTEIAKNILTKVKKDAEQIYPKPRLAIVIASNDVASHMYIKMKAKRAEEAGLEARIYSFDESTTAEKLIFEIRRFRNNDAINAVMLQLPLFKHLEPSRTEIINSIDPLKDADGLTAYQQGRVSHLLEGAILPATVEAVLECLNNCFEEDLTWENIQKHSSEIVGLKGKNVVILNNTNLIGKPLSLILSTLGATVTLANEFTTDLNQLTLQSDILVTATGKTKLLKADMLKKDSIVIDITSVKKDDKIIGDVVQSKDLEDKLAFLTPVPGGVGPLTIACLLRNVVRLCSV